MLLRVHIMCRVMVNVRFALMLLGIPIMLFILSMFMSGCLGGEGDCCKDCVVVRG